MAECDNNLGLMPQWADLNVYERVLETEDFIVFINDAVCCDYKTSDRLDAKGPKDKAKYARLMSEAAHIENSPHSFLTDQDKLSFKRLICEGIARILEDEYTVAKIALEAATAFLERRQNEQSREWYLLASACTTLVLLTLTGGIQLWAYLTSMSPTKGVLEYIIYITLGFVGALLSIIFRMGRTSFDYGARKNLHYLEAVMRILAGGITAFVAALAVKAKILFASVSASNIELEFLMFISIAAGALEKWIPSVIAAVGKQKLGTHSNGDSQK